MSFFDEADEQPRTETAPPRRAARRRESAGGGGSRGGRGRGTGRGGPPTQSIAARRAVAVVALVIVVVLIAIGVNSCQNSARKSALQDYANSVNSVIGRSDGTSDSLFKVLRSGVSSSDATTVSQQINQIRATAQSVLAQARGLSVPSSARSANANLLRALQMRLDGITNIAGQIQPALGSSVRNDAVKSIAAEMARFLASDVLYKDYTAPELVSALHANAIPVSGTSGAPVNSGQFLPSIDWLTPGYVAQQLKVSVANAGAKSTTVTSGPHGHALNSVSVGSTTLSTSATNTVTASPPPTFNLRFTNNGTHNETNVTCRITIGGSPIGATKVVPETFAGKSATCAVTLPSSPPLGTANVVAAIDKVPGESNVSDNTLTFPVQFK